MTVKLRAIASRVLLSGVLVAVLAALAVVAVIPRAVHGAALTVLTGSMTPTIPVGSVVLVRPVDPGTLHVGDVVTYQKAPGKAELITHRIIAIHTDTTPVTLITKGDANRGADVEPVPVTAVRGRVLFHVPYLGTFRNAVGTGGFGLLLVLTALVAYALTQLASALRDRRDATSAATAIPTAAIPEAVDGLSLQLLVATLSTTEFWGLLPSEAARLLRVDLLDARDEQFTIALVREPDQLAEFLEFLAPFTPLSLVRSEVVTVPVGTVSDRSDALPEVVGHRAS
jgi:signal peptidase